MSGKVKINSIVKDSNVIVATLVIGGKEEVVKISISEEYANNLVCDRIDALVWGLVLFCMEKGYNIVSLLPITDELYYNLINHYIRPLAVANKNLHEIDIIAPKIQPVKSTQEIVATGISCGIDSLYTIQQHTREVIPESMRVNTLVFFNAGSSFNGRAELHHDLVDGRLDLAKRFADEYGFKFIFVETNLHLILNKYRPYRHVEYHTNMALFCMYHIQSILSVYYYSSANPYNEFNMDVERFDDAAYRDLLTLSMASISNFRFYSSGGGVGRYEKTKTLLDFEPTYKYLNVCVENINNCSTCFKCVRTMLTLDALGVLEKFSTVFNLKEYNRNRFIYLKRLYVGAKYQNDVFLQEIYPFLEKEFSILMKLKIHFSLLKGGVRFLFKKWTLIFK